MSEDVIRRLHALVVQDLLPIEETGHYRRVSVVVGVAATGRVIFRPPDWEQVPMLMAGFEAWLNSPQAKATMPVLEAGIAHYEFVRIHLFTDGNGRTARALATLILAQRGFDTKRFFAVDEYYNQDRASCYEALRSVDPQTRDLTEWLEYFVQGIAVEMLRVDRRVEELGRLYRLESETGQVSLNPRQIKLLDHLRQGGGSISSGEYRELFAISKRTASNDLSELLAHGLLAHVLISMVGKFGGGARNHVGALDQRMTGV